MTTCSGLTPISWAAICASTVRMPSPISVTPVTILAVPPSSISAQAAARSTVAVRAMPYQQAAMPRPRLRAIIQPPLACRLAQTARRARRAANVSTVEIAARTAARVRCAGFPARGLFGASSARMRLTEPSFALVCVIAPSRIALMRRISNGSRPSLSAQMSRWDSVANAFAARRTSGKRRTACCWCRCRRCRPDVRNDVRPGRRIAALRMTPSVESP